LDKYKHVFIFNRTKQEDKINKGQIIGGGSSSVHRDLGWEPEGCRLKLLELVVVVVVVVVYLVDVKTVFGACKKFFYSLVAKVLLLNLMGTSTIFF